MNATNAENGNSGSAFVVFFISIKNFAICLILFYPNPLICWTKINVLILHSNLENFE